MPSVQDSALSKLQSGRSAGLAVDILLLGLIRAAWLPSRIPDFVADDELAAARGEPGRREPSRKRVVTAPVANRSRFRANPPQLDVHRPSFGSSLGADPAHEKLSCGCRRGPRTEVDLALVSDGP